LFVALYGSETGNLALKMLATGGVFIGGGIAPKILPRLAAGFMPAFLDKGRMRPLLASIPVKVVTNDKTALLGPAWHAAFADGAARSRRAPSRERPPHQGRARRGGRREGLRRRGARLARRGPTLRPRPPRHGRGRSHGVALPRESGDFPHGRGRRPRRHHGEA